MILVRVKALPPESATARAQGSLGFSDSQVLLMQLWQATAQSEEPHPWIADPIREEQAKSQAARIEAAQAREDQRQKQLAARQS